MFASGKAAAVSSEANYIEDVFSTYLYTGNDSSRTIENGIDLAGDGGLVWIKIRDQAGNHILTDTARGVNAYLRSNTTDASVTPSSNYGVTSFANNGFGLDQSIGSLLTNTTGKNYASWTFRKQPKFFDVVTYTGNGASARAINHNLGSTPGCMFVKRTDDTSDWRVYHVGCSTNKGLVLNDTAAETTSAIYWFGNEVNVIPPTSTQFTINSYFTNVNGASYVAYLFASNAGGFGLTGTDNVISCGSFTTDGSGNFSVNLGYEPQWILAKQATGSANNWALFDNMRGMSNTNVARLIPNSSSAESDFASPYCVPSATGFYSNSGGFFDASQTVIYIAIRRGPMKVPTSGTSVFSPLAYSGTGANNSITSAGFPPDMFFSKIRQSDNGYQNMMFDRLRGAGQYLIPTSTDAEGPSSNIQLSFDMSGVTLGVGNNANGSGSTYADYFFKRAPSFFDEVCYTGTNTTGPSIPHNLGVAPELMIVKNRTTATTNWWIYSASLGNTSRLIFTNAAVGTGTTVWNSTSPTSSVFTVGTPSGATNGITSETFVAYLFATCAGVSKVGSYTGTGTTKQVDCGFAAGARFVLIKRTDSTGDWYVWDTARGIVSGNDPYLLLNSTAAETTGTDYIDPYSAGFEISSTAPAAINASGGSFIFFAVA